MNYDLVISSQPEKVDIALLKDKRLVELHEESGNSAFQVGDLYLGRIHKVMPGLNAAFVDVGYEKDGFLHYLDLGPKVRSLTKFIELTRAGKLKSPMLERFRPEAEIEKTGKMDEVLKQGQEILVQVAKEPISTKGPRLTTELSFAGKFMVLVPFGDKVSISQKIKSRDESKRLKSVLKDLKPVGFGLIVRTAAENKKVADLEADLNDLVERWKLMIEKAKTAKPTNRVMGELSRTSSMIRDMLSANFDSIHVDSTQVYDEVSKYLASSPDKLSKLKMHKGHKPLFETLGLNKQIKAAFGKHVTFKNGSYLVIEHTEALHVIDVNSGPRTNAGQDQETNALDCNLEAAREVARQLRLRDMGGIIVVDFIDMHKAGNRKELYNVLKEEMKDDRAKHNILPPSKFGLVQITRQRVRPEMTVKTKEKCPSCDGTGEIEAAILFDTEIENSVSYVMNEQNEKQITLKLHPYIASYLTKTEKWWPWSRSVVKEWAKKNRGSIKVESSTNYTFMEYHIYNSRGEEIRLN
ncbi:MAG: Rne/Rng family ribonuclease [Bacteroidetes bacterium]|nr:MAG: Rne/Rng family ribonuclease [Bacteroidota bacterium]